MLKGKKALRRRHRLNRSRLPLALILMAAVLAAGFGTGPAGAAEPFQVVVHASNPVSELSAQEVSKMFLKKFVRWGDGTRVLPVDLEERSAVRETFSLRVHGKSTSAIKAFWQRMIFSGREVPPPEKKTAREVVDYVRGHKGAIGYVPVGTSLFDGVRPLRVEP